MMKKLTDINECDKIIRKFVIKSSELKPESVLNGLSLRGVDLEKLINDNKVYNSHKVTDNFIIFETYNRYSSNNVVLEEDSDGKVNMITSLTTKILIYGNTSNQLAHIIKGRLSSIKYMDDIYNEGIFIENISDPHSSNEFINDTMWIRHYIDINYSINLTLTNVNIYEDFKKINIKEVIINE